MAENNGSKELKSEVDALKEDLGKIRKDLHDLADTATHLGKDSAKYAREQVGENLHACMNRMDDYMQKQPLATVAMAFGAGFIAAKLFGRRG